MDQIIESFKRLFTSGQITEATLNSLLAKGTINQNEKDYIMRKEGE